jgi:hypothetical protein
MEGELWEQVYVLAKRLGKGKGVVRGKFLDFEIVAIYFWSVIHDRPIRWACDRRHWRGLRAFKRLPSPATMSRRLRCGGVQELIKQLEQQLLRDRPASWCRFIDGKPLPISGHSEDAGAGYGRSTGGKAKGYRFHGVFDESQGFVAWQIRPMNHNESKVAQELIATLKEPGYLVGDNQFDSSRLYDLAGERDIQLLVRRRRNVKGWGHGYQSFYRRKAFDMLQRPFAQALLDARRRIESIYSQLTSLAWGLAPLPNWVRTQYRVENWVRAKLIYFHLYRNKINTYNV